MAITFLSNLYNFHSEVDRKIHIRRSKTAKMAENRPKTAKFRPDKAF
jgi:hypothetical protein